MRTFQVFLLIFLCFTGLHDLEATNYSHQKEFQLRELIFMKNSYQKQTRPVATVDVNVSLSVITFNSLDVRDQLLTTTGYFRMAWIDKRLDWSQNPKFSSDIMAIHTDEETIWRPALILDNSVSDMSVMSDTSIPIRLLYDGSILWTPSGIYKTVCETDVTFYPFDTQVCEITVRPFGYTSFEIMLNSSPLAIDNLKKNGEWEYISSSTRSTLKGKGKNTFSTVSFIFILKRRPMYHVLNTLTPTILLAFLSCMAFKLPAESGERIGYSLTVLLSYAVYLTLVAEDIPATYVTTPLLSLYLLFILTLGMLSVILTIMVLECHHTDQQAEVPKWVMLTVDFLLILSLQMQKRHSHFCRCSFVKTRNTMDASKEVSNNLKKDTQEKAIVQELEGSYAIESCTWIEIGRLLDKSFLRLFLFIVFIVTCTFITALYIGYNTPVLYPDIAQSEP